MSFLSLAIDYFAWGQRYICINSHRFFSKNCRSDTHAPTHIATGLEQFGFLLFNPILKLFFLLTVWAVISDLHKMKKWERKKLWFFKWSINQQQSILAFLCLGNLDMVPSDTLVIKVEGARTLPFSHLTRSPFHPVSVSLHVRTEWPPPRLGSRPVFVLGPSLQAIHPQRLKGSLWVHRDHNKAKTEKQTLIANSKAGICRKHTTFGPPTTWWRGEADCTSQSMWVGTSEQPVQAPKFSPNLHPHGIYLGINRTRRGKTIKMSRCRWGVKIECHHSTGNNILSKTTRNSIIW